MTEETAVATEVAAPVEETVVETPAAVETPAPVAETQDIDFSDLYTEPEVTTVQPRTVEPDYDGLVDDLAAKILAKIAPKEEDAPRDAQGNYLTKEDLAKYHQQQASLQQAQQVIVQSITQAEQVKSKYVEKLKAQGVDFESQPALMNAADLLFKQMKIEKATQLGRDLINPITKVVDPVFSPKEMASLVQDHWKVFSSTYLGKLPASGAVASTKGLSPAVNAVASTQGQVAQQVDPVAELRKKREDGTLTQADLMSFIVKNSSQKK